MKGIFQKNRIRGEAAVIIWLMLLFLGIARLFWHNEWVYILPTPIPENYSVVNPSEKIEVSWKLKSDNNKSLFLHFFNPDCPCSRFNIPPFKSLVKQYGQDVTFVIMPMSSKNHTVQEMQEDSN